MPTLKLSRETPPGGWRYFQPETRLWFSGDEQGVYEMAERIVAHRRYANVPRGTIQEVMEDIHNQICERLGPAFCHQKGGGTFFHIKKDLSQNIDSQTAIAGTKAFIEFLATGRELVDRQEAFRRAEICRSCHLNTHGKGCVSCNGLNKLVKTVLKEERREPGLYICAACGCGLQAKVQVNEEVIKAADQGRDLTYPAWCWVPEILAKP